MPALSATTDKVSTWYYTQHGRANLGMGYASFHISDRRHKNCSAGDIAIVLGKDTDGRYLAHASVITGAVADNMTARRQTWGHLSGFQDCDTSYGWSVKHLTKIHDITDFMAIHNIRPNQAGLTTANAERVLWHLIELG